MKAYLPMCTIAVHSEEDRRKLEQFCDRRGFAVEAEYNCDNHEAADIIYCNVYPAGPVELTVELIAEMMSL